MTTPQDASVFTPSHSDTSVHLARHNKLFAQIAPRPLLKVGSMRILRSAEMSTSSIACHDNASCFPPTLGTHSGISVHVVRHDIRFAQAWLRRRLAQ